MKKRTQLNITPAVRTMAESNGAYFDNKLGAWFVDGEVPDPLISYAVKEERKRDYFAEQVPQCDQCGSQMVLRTNRTTGAPFWGCSAIRCCGSRPYEDKDVPTSNSRQRQVPQEEAASTFEDKVTAARIIARAIDLFRSEAAAQKWLETPKVGLRNYGKTPLKAIKTVVGCTITDRLLDERFDA